MQTKHSKTPFRLLRDLKGNPQLAAYRGLTIMASFHPAGFPSDEEMEQTAAFVITACNSHAALLAACKEMLADCARHGYLPRGSVKYREALIAAGDTNPVLPTNQETQ